MKKFNFCALIAAKSRGKAETRRGRNGDPTIGFQIHLWANIWDDNRNGYEVGAEIHPANGGTLGCIGLNGSYNQIYQFENNMINYFNSYKTINVFVPPYQGVQPQ